MEILVEPLDGDVQSSIDKVAAVGGGTVRLQPGRHVAGPVRLRDRVTLHISQGAILEFIPDYGDYLPNTVSVIAEASDRAYIMARHARDIAIVGEGKIAAAGYAFNTGFDESVGTFTPHEKRPRVLVLEDCENVRLEDFLIEDSPMWTVHLVRCRDVAINRLQVLNNRQLPNTDGIVIDSCSQVRVSHAVIRTADDGVCLKTSRSEKGIGHCEEIDVSDCIVESKSCALKIGTESFGDIRHVRFSRCRIEHSNRGLGIFSRDGGVVENVVFSDIEVDCHETPDGFWGSGEPLTITQLDRRPDRPAGIVRNVLVETLRGRCQGVINLYAEKGGGIDGVILRNVDLTLEEGHLGTAQQYDLRPTNADLTPPKGAKGRGNAWLRGSDGKIIGLVDYPVRLPDLFSHNVANFALEQVRISRPLA
jgi:hypothetical protein